MKKTTLLTLTTLLLCNICKAQNVERWINIGEGTYQQGFIYPYKLKLSVPYGVRSIEDIKQGLVAIKIDLLWLPNTTEKQAVNKIFSKQLEDHYNNLENYKLSKNLIAHFLKKLPSTKRHDEWVFVYYPDVGAKLFIDDKKVHHIVGAELNRALLQSWLNNSPVLTSNLFSRLLKLQ